MKKVTSILFELVPRCLQRGNSFKNKLISLGIFMLMGFNSISQDYYYIPDSKDYAKKSKSDSTEFATKPIFGIKAGLNLANQFNKDNQKNYGGYLICPGIDIGFSADYPIAKSVSFETGLLISTKGFKYSAQSYLGAWDNLQYYDILAKEYLFYLDIPLTLKFYFNNGETSRIYGVFGSYLGIGAGGIEKWKLSNLDDGTVKSGTDFIKFGFSDDSYYKPFDFGVIAGAGVELKQLKFELFYEYGLADIDSYNEDGDRTTNRVFGISMGYKFRKK